MTKKSQTSTEYLVITAVVIIIALIVVGTLGGIPGIGGGINKQVNDARIRDLPLGITTYFSDGYVKHLTVRNNHINTIRIINATVQGIPVTVCPLVSLALGHQQSLELVSATTGTYQKQVTINWQDQRTGAIYTEQYTLLGETAISPKPLNGTFMTSLVANNELYSSSAIDGCDNRYVAGWCIGSGCPDASDTHFTITSYDSSGAVRWGPLYSKLGTSSQARAIGVDGHNNIYIAGWCTGGDCSPYTYKVLKMNTQGNIIETLVQHLPTDGDIGGILMGSNQFVNLRGQVFIAGYSEVI